MQFALTVNLGNDAMRTVEDVAFALEQTAVNATRHVASDRTFTAGDSGLIRDSNGNAVGVWAVENRFPLDAMKKVIDAARLFCESTAAEMDELTGTESASAPAEFMLLHEAVKDFDALQRNGIDEEEQRTKLLDDSQFGVGL